MRSEPSGAPAGALKYSAWEAFSPAAMLLRGALYCYLVPRLRTAMAWAMIDAAVRGVTSRNYRARREAILGTLDRVTQGRLKSDANISDMVNLLNALAPEIARADRKTLAVVENC